MGHNNSASFSALQRLPRYVPLPQWLRTRSLA